jgi:hypothetical protein
LSLEGDEMVNAYVDHVFVLPEDEADADIANGFVTGTDYHRAIGVLKPAGGWPNVVDQFKTKEIPLLRKFPKRRIVLVVDFDGDSSRHQSIMSAVPNDLRGRVFIVGPLTTPEKLRKDLVDQGKIKPNTRESIGQLLAEDCRDGTDQTWSEPLLKHNANDIARMKLDLKPLLFS